MTFPGAPGPGVTQCPPRVVVGVGGGIAAFKAVSLVRLFTESGHDVTVVPTAAALRFVGAPTWSALSGKPVTSEVFDDVDQVRHVRLGQEADLVVVAPATANLLAKAACGLADDLLTNVLLTARGQVVMAPAMHTEMWQHPATVANVATLRARGVHVVEPADGRLTGADSGPGRLPEPDAIFEHCRALLASCHEGPSAAYSSALRLDGVLARWVDGNLVLQDLDGLRVVVTAGGTREALDPVRYLGNRSSGKQGIALARAAADRGADVVLVAGSLDVPPPDDRQIEVQRVESARDMQTAVQALTADAAVVVMAAAVADFRPAHVAQHKIKKSPDDDGAPVVELVRNPDILRGLVEAREQGSTPLLVGFAAETGDDTHTVLALGREKLARKGCDLLVVNEVGIGRTFGADDNAVTILAADAQVFADAQVSAGAAGSGAVREVQGTKLAVAHAIWDSVAALLPH